MDSNPKLSPLQVETDQAGDMTVKKVLSSLKTHGIHGLQHMLKSDITESRLSVQLYNIDQSTERIVELVVPELDFTPIKDDADDTRTRDDEIRRGRLIPFTIIMSDLESRPPHARPRPRPRT